MYSVSHREKQCIMHNVATSALGIEIRGTRIYLIPSHWISLAGRIFPLSCVLEATESRKEWNSTGTSELVIRKKRKCLW